MANTLYTAKAHVTGGRAEGHGRSSDGELEVDLRLPAEMGGPGGGTNPEELFAVGYAACFEGALGVVARRAKAETGDAAIDSEVSLSPDGKGGFLLGVALNVTLPGISDEATAVDLVRAAHQGDAKFPNPLVDSHTVFCAAGMPHLMVAPFDYEFIVTPEETWMIVDKETRHIYTDGRKFPPEDEMWPTLLGRSIGHWEGQTLVVETVSVRPGIWADLTPALLSGQQKYLERIRQVDANTLEDQITITDPVALTKPWSTTKHYSRMKQGTWAAEPETCGGPEDRNPIVGGRLTTVIPGGK